MENTKSASTNAYWIYILYEASTQKFQIGYTLNLSEKVREIAADGVKLAYLRRFADFDHAIGHKLLLEQMSTHSLQRKLHTGENLIACGRKFNYVREKIFPCTHKNTNHVETRYIAVLHKNKENMKYKAIQRVNPQNKSKSKWYAAPVNEGRVAKTELAKEVVDVSSLSRGDVSNVIESLIDVIPKYLLMGKSVNLGELGTFRVSFGSEGVDTEAEVTANKITGLKIVFTPSVELKKRLADIRFESNK